MPWIVLTLAVVLNATANVLMKAAVRSMVPLALAPAAWLRALANPYLLLGVFTFVLALGAYTYSLARFPLSVAYPILVSMGLLVVGGASALLFQETFTLTKAAGSLLILGGAVLLTRSM